MVWKPLLRNWVADVIRSNERRPETRTGLLNVTPQLIDFTIITALSCDVYTNRRHETYTAPSTGLMAICGFCTSRDPVLRGIGALQVCAAVSRPRNHDRPTARSHPNR